jgi:hypothetical protein
VAETFQKQNTSLFLDINNKTKWIIRLQIVNIRHIFIMV